MLHTIRRVWKLRREDCPCDLHFLDLIADQGLRNQTIFHFGTGDHHLVGLGCARAEAGNVVMGITATPKEHDAYVKLAMAEPEMTKRYVAYFGDIYTVNPRLLPELDLVTLFHLCEFRDEKNDRYGALTDAELVETLAGRVRPGGRILFYTGSYAYAQAAPIIEAWAASSNFSETEGFKSLRIFQRR